MAVLISVVFVARDLEPIALLSDFARVNTMNSRLRLRISGIRVRCLFQNRPYSNTQPPEVTNRLALVQDSLKKYLRWFPQDAVTYSNIQTYLDLRRNSNRTQSIVVGIIYETDEIRQSSRLLESMLADPLASGNEKWFKEIQDRSREKNNMISYAGADHDELFLPGAFERSVSTYEIPSPLLSADYRQRFPEIFPTLDSKPNNLAILEINGNADVTKLTDVCHFFVYVTNEFSTLLDRMPRDVQKKILLTVVDNSEFSPSSSELTAVTFNKTNVTHHAIKVNSTLDYKGITDFLEIGTEAGGAYFENLRKSNILEVAKFLQWYLRTENLRDWLFRIICTQIATNNLSEKLINETYEDLKLNAVAECSSSMHAELQQKLIPETTDFFRHKLRWWMLYWKNDNVEYMLKDFFNAHFMNKSAEAYNYVRGQLTARLQEQKYAAYSDSVTVENPLQVFKADLINNRITLEVQPVVYSSLVSGLMYYQLPISALSLFGYLWFGILAESAFALGLFGWVLGFNHVSREWDTFSKQWLADLFEQVRLVIGKGCIDNGLLKELGTRYDEAKLLATIKKQVLDELENHK